MGELMEKNDALEAMVLALKEQTEEFKGELNTCKAALEQYFHAKGIMDYATK
ncbi:hypothetical protein J1N35_044413, partial [Gossypium stocksii]